MIRFLFARVTTQRHVTHGQLETSTPNCQQATKVAPTVCLIVRKLPIPWPTQRQTLGCATRAIWILPPSANLILPPTNSIDGCQLCCLSILIHILLTWICRPTRESATLAKWLMENCLRSWQWKTAPMMPMPGTLLSSTFTMETQSLLVILDFHTLFVFTQCCPRAPSSLNFEKLVS